MSSRSGRSGSKKNSLRTFTYFIPAPTHRKSGYREREFDKIMSGILQSGFKLEELHTQSVENGLFVLALISPANAKAAKLDQDFDLQERFRLSHTHSSPDIIIEEEDDA